MDFVQRLCSRRPSSTPQSPFPGRRSRYTRVESQQINELLVRWSPESRLHGLSLPFTTHTSSPRVEERLRIETSLDKPPDGSPTLPLDGGLPPSAMASTGPQHHRPRPRLGSDLGDAFVSRGRLPPNKSLDVTCIAKDCAKSMRASPMNEMKRSRLVFCFVETHAGTRECRRGRESSLGGCRFL